MGNILGAVVQQCISAANEANRPNKYSAGAAGGQSGEELRQRANELFQQRNHAFEQSKACYARGDHAGTCGDAAHQGQRIASLRGTASSPCLAVLKQAPSTTPR